MSECDTGYTQSRSFTVLAIIIIIIKQLIFIEPFILKRNQTQVGKVFDSLEMTYILKKCLAQNHFRNA